MDGLSYSCLKSTLRYLSVEKRAKLVEKVPRLRSINKLLPYRIHHLFADGSYGNMTVRFDSIKWKFHHFEALGTHRMITPAGKKYDLETLPHHVDMSDFLRFYLDREGTVVMNFKLENFGAKLVFDTMLHRAHKLHVFYTKNLGVESFNQFSTYSRIPIVKVFNNVYDNNALCESLKKISMEELFILNTTPVADDVYLTLTPSKKIDYYELHFNFARLKEYCLKLQCRMTNLTGSTFAGDFRITTEQFLEGMKTFLNEMMIEDPFSRENPYFHLHTVNPNQHISGQWIKKGERLHRIIIQISKCRNQ